MTVLVAMPCKDGVWVGADSMVSVGRHVDRCDVVKWRIGPPGLSVGVSGHMDGADDFFEIAETHHDAVSYCAAVREHLCANGWDGYSDTSAGEAGPPRWGVSMIVTDGERIWDVMSSLIPSLAPPGRPVVGGSGHVVAGTVLDTMSRVDARIEPSERVRIAVEVTIERDTTCGGRPYLALAKRPTIETRGVGSG